MCQDVCTEHHDNTSHMIFCFLLRYMPQWQENHICHEHFSPPGICTPLALWCHSRDEIKEKQFVSMSKFPQITQVPPPVPPLVLHLLLLVSCCMLLTYLLTSRPPPCQQHITASQRRTHVLCLHILPHITCQPTPCAQVALTHLHFSPLLHYESNYFLYY
jgi:hypothetical protein